ncbi:Lacal_2735 family protein [Aureitalea sp. L0-47]|uniref:Lacal_2735 family protein n=1 Tax=Aureitalea sp. L0-47 TaxID=2816962 RepID=UPI002237BF12|nr:Lacal_2735 family protein [Aureitalea sp. L0-47]MCW5519257.1 Lacal_2735 family protein [Aureitalea sp. L0-47]
MNWLEENSELQKLKKQYSDLMRLSYEIALKDKKESDRINREAKEIYEKIMLYQAKESLL